ncbi:MAG: tRNA pseudouridine(13) synthase TruD [Phycisphaerales bacterium]|nr:tRNA pseudouridine(13) synthase TruD [Phycisphaerales bacterium]
MTIRRLPGDFWVRERLREGVARAMSPEPGPGREVGVWVLMKESLSTPEATAKLARALGLAPAAVTHAGLKDKHALTEQHVCARATAADRAEGPGWSARRLGFSSQVLTAADIECNKFEIIVRDLGRATCNEMLTRARGLGAESGDAWFVNYFGDQRFGSARHGEGFAAAHLVKGEFVEAVRLLIATPARKDTGTRRVFTRTAAARWGEWEALAKELPRCPERAAVEVLAAGGSGTEAFAALPHFLQEMCVDAWQSHLWNEAARRLVAGAGTAEGAESGDRKETHLLAAARAAELADVTMPLPGPEMVMREPWGGAMDAVLRGAGVIAGELRTPGLRRPRFGSPERTVLARASGFSLDGPREDTEVSGRGRLRMRVRFQLPSGSYATEVLRALGQ